MQRACGVGDRTESLAAPCEPRSLGEPRTSQLSRCDECTPRGAIGWHTAQKARTPPWRSLSQRVAVARLGAASPAHRSADPCGMRDALMSNAGLVADCYRWSPPRVARPRLATGSAPGWTAVHAYRLPRGSGSRGPVEHERTRRPNAVQRPTRTNRNDHPTHRRGIRASCDQSRSRNCSGCRVRRCRHPRRADDGGSRGWRIAAQRGSGAVDQFRHRRARRADLAS